MSKERQVHRRASLILSQSIEQTVCEKALPRVDEGAAGSRTFQLEEALGQYVFMAVTASGPVISRATIPQHCV